MSKNNTDDLQQELMSTMDLDEFLAANSDDFRDEAAMDILNTIRISIRACRRPRWPNARA